MSPRCLDEVLNAWISHIRKSQMLGGASMASAACAVITDVGCPVMIVIIWKEQSAGSGKWCWSCNMCRKQRVDKGVKTKNKQN